MIFSEDNTSFSLIANPLISLENIKSGLWLALVGVNETPPHISLISDGKYYSLSTRKVDCGSPLTKFLNAVERKRIPSLFVRIESQPQIHNLDSHYENLQPLNNTENTCLSPIKAFFAENFSSEFSEVKFVFELLALAEKKDLLKECVSLFSDNTNSKIITLPKYTMLQIKNRIQEISPKLTSIK